MSRPFVSPLVLKQKRGPGFKYASNLPGSLLREQKPVKEEGDAPSAAKRRPDREETPRYRPDELLHRQPPLLSPCNLARAARPEDKLRKKRKLFDDEDDDDDDDDLCGRKKVCIEPFGRSLPKIPSGSSGFQGTTKSAAAFPSVTV